MKRVLFIIGNGFDRAHNLPTDYKNDFVRILKKINEDQFQFINKLYFNGDEDLWKDFEENIGNVKSVEHLEEEYSEKLERYFSENSDPNQYSYPIDSENYGNEDMEVENARYEAEVNRPKFELDYTNFGDFLNERLKVMLNMANQKLEDKNIIRNNDLTITSTDYFVNFNYTNTLEKIYNIPINHILYIHGTVKNMIYGNQEFNLSDIASEDFNIDHENPYISEIPIEAYHTSLMSDYLDIIKYSKDDIDENLGEIVEQLNDENSSFEKELQIKKLEKFLANLPNDISKICVLGHSIGKVDIPYFEFMRKKIPVVPWNISYYKDPKSIANYENLSFSKDINIFEFPKR